jgi:hypothetical protein
MLVSANRALKREGVDIDVASLFVDHVKSNRSTYINAMAPRSIEAKAMLFSAHHRGRTDYGVSTEQATGELIDNSLVGFQQSYVAESIAANEEFAMKEASNEVNRLVAEQYSKLDPMGKALSNANSYVAPVMNAIDLNSAAAFGRAMQRDMQKHGQGGGSYAKDPINNPATLIDSLFE